MICLSYSYFVIIGSLNGNSWGKLHWKTYEILSNCTIIHRLSLGSYTLLLNWSSYETIDYHPWHHWYLWHLWCWFAHNLAWLYQVNLAPKGPFWFNGNCFLLAILFHLHISFLGKHHLLVLLFHLNMLQLSMVVFENYHCYLSGIGAVVVPHDVVILFLPQKSSENKKPKTNPPCITAHMANYKHDLTQGCTWVINTPLINNF